jgi:hypothetical protein
VPIFIDLSPFAMRAIPSVAIDDEHHLAASVNPKPPPVAGAAIEGLFQPLIKGRRDLRHVSACGGTGGAPGGRTRRDSPSANKAGFLYRRSCLRLRLHACRYEFIAMEYRH